MAETLFPISDIPRGVMKNSPSVSNFDFSFRSEAPKMIKCVPADPACRRIILTGAVQCGKSALAEKLINRLKEKNIAMAGILARGLWKNNKREGFDLMDIQTGKVTPLARLSAESVTQNHDQIPFSFFESGVTAGFNALSFDRCKNASVIIVDEVGKLESKGLGWTPCLAPLLTLSRACHIWIVREKLVRPICRIWPVEQTIIIHADAPDAFLNLKTACAKES